MDKINLSALRASLLVGTSSSSSSGNRPPENSALHSLLTAVISALEPLKNPIPKETTISLPEGEKLLIPTTYEVTLNKNNVTISWDNPDVAAISYFDVRRGDDFETAERVAFIPIGLLILNPVNVGEHRYLIGSVGPGGESIDQLEVTFTIPALGYLSIESTVIDNFIRLEWEEPESTFDIDYYIFKRGNVRKGKISNTFLNYFESSAGTNTYSIAPVDIAGNVGPEISESVEVRNPIDFEFQGKLPIGDADSISLTNVYDRGNDTYLVPVNTTETWNEHFTNNSVTSIQGLIDAGYNIWCQPNKSPGSITFNYTTSLALTNVIVELDWTTREIIPSVAVAVSLSTGSDTYTGKSNFVTSLATSFSVTLTFTATGQGILELLGFQVSIIVKKAQDGGSIAALSTDGNGTLVDFNRDFLGIPDVAATVKDTGDFRTTINSITTDSFRVKVYSSTGGRSSKAVEWLARGII